MSTTLIQPPQNVITGANQGQQATLANDLTQVQSSMIGIFGGISPARQGKRLNNTWTNVEYVTEYPTPFGGGILTFEHVTKFITSAEDITISLPLTFTFQQEPGPTKSLADWTTPKTDYASVWNNMVTPQNVLLDLFKRVELKLGKNNVNIMNQTTSSNQPADFEALKAKRHIDTFLPNNNERQKICLGLPFGNNYDASLNPLGLIRTHIESDNHIREYWNNVIQDLYDLAFTQYYQDNNNYVPGNNSGQLDALKVNVLWPFPLRVLHEFFDNSAWLPIGFSMRLDLTMQENPITVATAPSTEAGIKRNITVQLNPTSNKFSMFYLGRHAKTEYIRDFNTQSVMENCVYLCNRVENRDIKNTAGNGVFESDFLTTEQHPRFITVQAYWNAPGDPPSFTFANYPNTTQPRYNQITNLAGKAMAGFVVRSLRITTNNGTVYPLDDDYSILQNTSNFNNQWAFNEEKYTNELLEKPTNYEVPVFQNNLGDYTKPLFIRINMDVTYDQSLGNTTLLNGQTNGKITVVLACVDPNFKSWDSITLRINKWTEYQVAYSPTDQASVIQFPASAGENQTSIIPQQVPVQNV